MDGSNRYCGVFRVTLPGGAVTPVIQSADCHYKSAWLSLSLSPDGTHAIAIQNNSLQLIDIAGRAAKSLGDGFIKASWSPDGQWIAALENGAKWRTVLFDAVRLSRTKVLPTSETQWSPDSRYLLSVGGWGCFFETGTIQTLDIQSGAKATIKSSRCKVYMTSTGWVSSEIVP